MLYLYILNFLFFSWNCFYLDSSDDMTDSLISFLMSYQHSWLFNDKAIPAKGVQFTGAVEYANCISVER